ncbi:HD domain-containing protein [Nonomuraea typhae]|uniref:HD domain-containing protein n=1 Tax=Nonomuraea typhae TaxID=2603600 RepID=UPI0015E23CFF|nr:HD domain-containing protein [Nonomuraea typhae]
MSIAPLLDVLPPDAPRELIERAYTVAAYWHRGQRRHSGQPYVTHPVAVAVILAGTGADAATLCAALLHDLPEDTGCRLDLLEQEFGREIAGLVRQVHQLDHEEPGPGTDSRALAVKVADRLHNMRTIAFVAPEKQVAKSRHTLEVLAPLARRLGLSAIGAELEHLAAARLVRGLTAQAVAIGSILLPAAERPRWCEEWAAELRVLPGRGARVRFAVLLLAGMPRMALTLRGGPAPARRPWMAGLTPTLRTGRMRVRQALRTAGVWGRRALGWLAWPNTRGRRALGWLVRSNVRVAVVFAPLVAWMVAESAATSLGDAAAVLITVPPVLAAGVAALRKRLDG